MSTARTAEDRSREQLFDLYEKSRRADRDRNLLQGAPAFGSVLVSALIAYGMMELPGPFIMFVMPIAWPVLYLVMRAYVKWLHATERHID